MQSDDIVARIRVWSTWLDERCPDTDIGNDLREAADEIERLRGVVNGTANTQGDEVAKERNDDRD